MSFHFLAFARMFTPQMMNRWIGVGVLAAAFLAGCNKSSRPQASPSSMTDVALALNWKPEPEFGGFYAADVDGFYKQHRLKVDITGGGDQVPQMVAAGQSQFGILAADEVVTARAKGIDLVALFAVYQTNPQGIMCHVGVRYKSIADVMNSAGTLAVQPGLPYVNFLEKKYPRAAVKIVPYDYSIVQFMEDPNYAQQCFVTSEPIAAEQKGVKTKVFLIADEGFNPYATVVVTRGQYLREHPEIVHDFVQAVGQGWRAYLDDPRPADQMMEQLNREMDAATFAAAAAAQKPLIDDAQTKAHGLGSMTEKRWSTLIAQLLDLKVIDHAPVAKECFINPAIAPPASQPIQNSPPATEPH
jgi:NitT/TauT family transport system substrate-binding protein